MRPATASSGSSHASERALTRRPAAMTTYDDQPPEHWAGAASLDPTPVWKQYLIVVLLLIGALAVIGVAAALAIAPQLATPPALVPGNRLVLARAELPGVMKAPLRIGKGIVPERQALWILQVADREYIAVSAYWSHPDTGERCPVLAGSLTPGPAGAVWRAGPGCEGHKWNFGPRGDPLNAPRSLDRYLVSVEGDRVIVNLSRAIRGFGKSPQPTRSPL